MQSNRNKVSEMEGPGTPTVTQEMLPHVQPLDVPVEAPEHWINTAHVITVFNDDDGFPTTWFDPTKEGYEPIGCNDFPVFNLRVAFVGRNLLVRSTDVRDGSETTERFPLSEFSQITVTALTPETKDRLDWEPIV